MNPKTHFGPFYGQDLTTDEADAIAISHIPGKVLAAEPGLMRSKWFDYRLLHPTVATYLFAQCYSKAYQRYVAVTQDHERALFVKGFKGKDFIDNREKVTFWKLRQKCDELGMRYDFFLQNAVNFCIANGWKQPPRPAHIYTNPDMIVDIMDSWHHETKARLQFPKDAHYRVENFTGSPDQLAFEAWLLDHVATRQHRKYSLHASIYVEGMMRIESAIERFGAETVSDAADYALQESNHPQGSNT